MTMVITGVSSTQFMDDALKQISCKLGCRDVRSDQEAERAPDTASYAPVIVVTT